MSVRFFIKTLDQSGFWWYIAPLESGRQVPVWVSAEIGCWKNVRDLPGLAFDVRAGNLE